MWSLTICSRWEGICMNSIICYRKNHTSSWWIWIPRRRCKFWPSTMTIKTGTSTNVCSTKSSTFTTTIMEWISTKIVRPFYISESFLIPCSTIWKMKSSPKIFSSPLSFSSSGNPIANLFHPSTPMPPNDKSSSVSLIYLWQMKALCCRKDANDKKFLNTKPFQ